MAYSLRKRIGKRIANGNSKSPSPDSGAENHSNDSKPELTTEPQDEKPLLQNDASAMPQPPARNFTSAKEPIATTSPPQSLLDKFQKREAKASLQTATTHATYKAGKDTAFSEHFDVDSPRMSSEWVDIPGNPETRSDEDVEGYDSVKFEAMGKKGQVAEAPNADNAFVYERRTTRSQSRRQHRADSADGAEASKKDASLVPSGLTIKKINDMETSRTPSPNAVAGKDARSPGKVAPTPANSPSTTATAFPKPTTLVVDRTKGKAEYLLSTSPDTISSEKTITPGRVRELPQPPANKDDAVVEIPTPVIPPLFNPNIRSEHIWTSPLAGSGRPDYPWGWMKKWSCCQCAHMDPAGRNRPAETMVEQKVCSRLKCKHVRCGMGCRMLKDSMYSNASSFMSP